MVTPTMPHTIDGIGLGMKSVGDYTFNLVCKLSYHTIGYSIW